MWGHKSRGVDSIEAHVLGVYKDKKAFRRERERRRGIGMQRVDILFGILHS